MCFLRNDNSIHICFPGFQEGFLLMDDLNGLEFMQNVNGSVPDGVYDTDTGFFFCCRSDGEIETPIVLPKDQPFVLFMANGSTDCQSVRGRSQLLITLHHIAFAAAAAAADDDDDDDDDGRQYFRCCSIFFNLCHSQFSILFYLT